MVDMLQARIWRMMGELVFQRHHSGRLKFSAHVLEEMLQFKQNKPHLSEAGGILLGRYLLEGDDIVVDQITLPTTRDRRSRYRFYRHHKAHQDIIDRVWHASAGTCTYLGEWHTHPEAQPIPSPVDWNNWRRKLQGDQYADCLFFVIIGTDHVCVWEGFRRSKVIYSLSLSATG
jgi:integrative and conjugative element protein (TIGR02256 family)